MKRVLLCAIAALVVMGCGGGRDVVTQESYEATKAEQAAMAAEMGPEAVEQVQRGLYCAQQGWVGFPPSWGCITWCPNVNPGMYDCYSDQNTYPGETNFWFGTSFSGGCCQGFSGGGDWASLNADTNDKIKSAKCRRSAGTRIWQESGFWGTSTLLLNGQDYATIPFVNGISSISTD